MNRIDQQFDRCRRENRKALVMFVSAGDPSLATTEKLIPVIAEAGADVIEIGVPFSDPMADGPTIQAASQRALDAGTTLSAIMDMIRRVRQAVDVPMVLFSYYNVLMQYGIEKLARESVDVGIDGWLVVDVPMEEKDEVEPVLRAHGLKWITLVAPTTGRERAATLLADAEGFVYCITVTGVTGARSELPPDLKEHLTELKELSPVPVVAGFGVSSPEMAAGVSEHCDGVVVGSALIKLLASADSPDAGITDAAEFVASLSAVLR